MSEEEKKHEEEFEKWWSPETVNQHKTIKDWHKATYLQGRKDESKVRGEEIDLIKKAIKTYLDDPERNIYPLSIIVNPKLKEAK